MRVRYALEHGFGGRLGKRRVGAQLPQSWNFAGHDLLRRESRPRAAIDTALVAGIARDLDLGQTGKPIVETVPEPDRDALERGLCETFHLVQQAMVQRTARVRDR